MKFKKLLSLSAVLVTGLTMSVPWLVRDGERSDSNDGHKQEVYSLWPDLKFKTDTLHITNENFQSRFMRASAGIFVPGDNSVHLTYITYDSTANALVKANSDAANEAARVVLRHEMEHARKANITQNIAQLSPWNRARLAIMNESMAPAGEIIESQEYRLETGERFPQNRNFLWEADSLIMARHNQIHHGNGKFKPVDFSDPVIADILLDKAVDKFAKDHKKGFYKSKIKKELQGVKRPVYKPHNQCDPLVFVYAPDANQWGALWTYDVSAPWHMKRRVDVWNSATITARHRAINKVDSIIKSDLEPGQILYRNLFKKPR